MNFDYGMEVIVNDYPNNDYIQKKYSMNVTESTEFEYDQQSAVVSAMGGYEDKSESRYVRFLTSL